MGNELRSDAIDRPPQLRAALAAAWCRLYVEAEQHRLTIDHEQAVGVSQRGLNDARRSPVR